MISLSKEKYQIILFLVSTLALFAAYFIQYILGYQPCNLCIIERVPYALSLIVLLLNYRFKNNQNFYSALLLIIFSFSLLLSIYHLGIEQGLVAESNLCVSDDKSSIISKEAILKSFKEFTVSCKDVALKIFGLSLTTYNIVLSLIMLLISFKIYSINNEIKK
jgi:disulfide bond formation protein DsbB